MARTKTPKRPSMQARRTTWTRFYLPRGQDWPTWSSGHSDARLGPLADVPGCCEVWLGRMVDDPEQAALIVLWTSVEFLKNFQNSPACEEFLQSLPENDMQASLVSGALLRGLSLSDADDASLLSARSRFLSFGWKMGFGSFNWDLQGRITLTAFALPYTACPIPEPWRDAVYGTFSNFLPTGCEELRSWRRVKIEYWSQWAWVDSGLSQLEQQAAAAGNKSYRTVLCQFRRWNGSGGATRELEEASAKSPLARESWAREVAKVMPPVTAWEQQRWDIQSPPAREEEEEGMDCECEEDQRNLDEFLKQNLSSR
ncbi:hypothetical protein F5Y06DRAFT_70979 [Hypoxylon sp. FL0890]|nr:hypothetical protein F5Y06DRAFT_70979 [Hypoxylon sp. FL0890]